MFRNSTADLFKAIVDGNVAQVPSILERINDINVRNEHNKTLLQEAVVHSWKGDKWRQIIDHIFTRSDLSIEDINVALVYYAGIGDLAKVKECLDRGANINSKYNNTALLNAIEGKHINIVHYLLTFENIDINLVDDYLNESPLMKAVFNHLPEVVNLLLAKGNVELHIQGHLTGTALTYAIFSGQNDVAEKLLAEETVFCNQDHPGALNCAIIRESKEMIALLVGKGANINMAGYEGTQETPDYVWQMNPDEYTYPSACREVFTTPLCCAIRQEHGDRVGMIKLILKTYGADPNKMTPENELPLIIAARREDKDVFKLLLDNGADLQQEISSGRTVQSEIRDSYLIPYTIKRYLEEYITSQTSLTQTATAHNIISYQGSFITQVGVEGFKTNLTSVQIYLQHNGQKGREALPPDIEDTAVNVVSLLLRILSEEKRAECLEKVQQFQVASPSL